MTEKKPPLPPRNDEDVQFGDHLPVLPIRNAVLFPGASGAGLSARPGYPTVLVPFGGGPLNPTPPWPAGFEPPRSPYGVSFAAGACSEPRLIALAYAFEQASLRRVAPPP